MDCCWDSGGQHLFCTGSGSTPGGVYQDVMVFMYDTEAMAHRGFEIDNPGMATQFRVPPGKTADGCPFRQELASEGGPFTVISEGSARKLTQATATAARARLFCLSPAPFRPRRLDDRNTQEGST